MYDRFEKRGLGLCMSNKRLVGCGEWNRHSWSDLGNDVIAQERERVAARLRLSDMGISQAQDDRRASGVLSQLRRM